MRVVGLRAEKSAPTPTKTVEVEKKEPVVEEKKETTKKSTKK